MNAQRDAVLGAVRSAVSGFVVTEPERAYAVSLPDDTDLIDLLVDRLIDYRASVVDLRTATTPDVVRDALTDELRARAIDRVVLPVDFPSECRPSGVDLIEDRGMSALELEAMPAALTTSAGAVALSGTILLDHGAGQGRRAVSLLPDVHLCLVDARTVTGTLVEAIASMGPREVMTWISGPSATSDIELVRVEGVHGPRTLVVVIHSLGSIGHDR